MEWHGAIAIYVIGTLALIIYVVLFIFFRHYLVALIGLFFCAILPFALTLLAVPKNQN